MTLTQEHRDRLKGKGLLSKIVVDSLVKASGEDPQIEGGKKSQVDTFRVSRKQRI